MKRESRGWGRRRVCRGLAPETVEAAEAACGKFGEWIDAEALGELPVGLVCLRNAVAAARVELEERARIEDGAERRVVDNAPYLGVAALLPAGRAVLGALGPKVEAGFRVFKWKVGVGDVADELGLLDDVCAALPSGAKLRLDANGAWIGGRRSAGWSVARTGRWNLWSSRWRRKRGAQRMFARARGRSADIDRAR